MYIFVTCFGIGLIILSNVIAIPFVSNLMKIDMTLIHTNNVFFISATLLAKIVNFILCLLSLKLLKKNNNSLLLNKWWLFLVFLSLVLIAIIVLFESILLNNYNKGIPVFLLFVLVSLLLLSFVIYYKIDLDNKKQMELNKKLLRNQYINKNYTKMNYLYNKTVDEKHKMMYRLIKYKHLIKEENYKELLESLETEIYKIDRIVPIQSTSNPYFDFRLSEIINELKEQEYDIKSIVQLNELAILSNEDVVNDIINAIEWVSKYSNNQKHISLSITQKKVYLIIKIKTYADVEEIEDLTFENEYIKSHINCINCILELNLLVSNIEKPNHS